jgi:hypothetical protein
MAKNRRNALARNLLVAASVLFLTTCDAFKAGLGPKIDISAPTVDVSSISNGSYLKGTVNLTGVTADDVGVKSVVLVVTVNSVQVGSIPATISGGTWSAPLDTVALSSNLEVQADIDIRVTDGSDKTSDKKIVVYFDNVKPVITSIMPTTDNLSKSNYAISEKEAITGSVRDGLGVAKVELVAGTIVLTETDHSAAWSLVIDAAQFYDPAHFADLPNHGARNGAGYDAAKKLYTVPYSVQATDFAGNASTAVTGTFFVNPDGSPIVDLTGQTPAIFDTTTNLYSYPYSPTGWTPNSVTPSSTIKFSVFDMDGLDTSASGLYIALAPGSTQTPTTRIGPPAGLNDVTIYDKASVLYPLTVKTKQTTQLADGTAIPIEIDCSLKLPDTMPQGLGEYLLYICAKDYAANKLAPSVAAVRTLPLEDSLPVYKYVSLYISSGDPKVTITQPVDSANLQAFVTTGNITDDLGPATVSIRIDNVDEGTIPLVTDSGTLKHWTAYSVPALTLGEGLHTVVFTGTNVTGATSAAPVTRNFIIDTTAPTASVNAIPGYQSGSIGIGGSSSDPDPGTGSSGVARVEYQLGGTAGAWTTAVSSAPWTGNLDLSAYAEGASTLYVRSLDNAGNVSVLATTGINVDRANPVATETAYTSALIQTRTDLFFHGAASDAAITAGRAAVSATLSYSKDGAASVALGAPDGFVWNPVSGAWAYMLPVSLGDGLYVLTLTVTDVAGKSSSVSRTAQIDTTAPTLLVAAPVDNESTSSTTYVISGTSRDTGGVGFSGTNDVEYSTDSGGTWSALALTGTSWSHSLNLGASEGARTLIVRSTDRLGNQASSGTLNYFYDLNPPVMSETGVAAGNPSTFAMSTNATIHFSGSVTDTDALAVAGSFTVAIDGAAAVNASTLTTGPYSYASTSPDSRTLNWQLDATVGAGGLADGSHAFVFYAKDIAGKTASVSRTVTVDTTRPASVIVTPSSLLPANPAYWLSGPSGSVGGTASDSGSGASGVASVYYTTAAKGAGQPAFSTSTWTLAAGTANWNGSVKLTGAGSIGQGEFTLYVAAVDAVGNVQTAVGRDFGADQDLPTLSESHSLSYATRNVYTLSGTIGDTNALASLSVTEKKGAAAAVAVTLATPATVGGTSQTWSTVSLPLGGLSDGSYLYTIIATDVAGKTTQTTRTVNIDTTAPNASLTALPAWISGSAYTIGGTASDPNAGASGVATIAYNLDSSGYVNATWIDGSGGANTSGTWNATLSSLTEGIHSVVVQATDAATNSTTLGSASLGVDFNAPSLSVAASPAILTNATAAAFSGFSGTTGDTNAMAAASALSVTYSKDGGAPTTTAITYADTPHSTTNAWTWTPFGSGIDVAGHGDDGTYSFVFTATDAAGKQTVSANRSLTVDTALPTVSFSYPNSGSSLNGLVTARGTASDNAQVATVEYSLNGGATYTAVTSDRYSWNFSFDTRSAAQGGTPGLTQGAFTLRVRARDSSGNYSTVATLPLVLDQISDYPVITLTNMDQSKTDSGGAASNLQETNAKVQGTIADDDWVDATTIEYSVDGGTWSAPTVVGSSSTNVSFEQSLTGLADGIHYINLRASDSNDGANNRKGGLPSVQSTLPLPVYFAVDKSNPVVVINTPGSLYTTGPVTLTGTVTDGNRSMQVLFSTDGGATYSATGVSGFSSGLGARGWTWNGSLAAKPDGPFDIKVKGIDEYNKESIADVIITVDRTGPVMSIITPITSSTVNGPVSISGQGVETYGLDHVQVAITPQGQSPIAGDWVAAIGSYAWSYVFDSTTRGDGVYTISVRGFDVAGNASAANATRDFTISQASDRPSLSQATIQVGGTYVQNLLPGSLQISGTASDDDAVAHASVQIRIDRNNDGLFNAGDGGWQNWVNVTGQPAIDANIVNWSQTFPYDALGVTGLPDGRFGLEIRVGDVNFWAAHPTAGTTADWTTLADGFKWTTSGLIHFAIDSAPPGGSVTAPAQGVYLRDPGSHAIAIAGTALDGSGILGVQIKVNSGAAQNVTDTGGATPFSTWTYSYPIGADGQVSYQIIITDNFNKITTIDRYFTVDTTAPSSAFSQPTAGSTVNGALTIRGTSSDTYQVASVYLWIGAHNATPTGDPANGVWTGWNLLAGTYNWSYSLDTRILSDGAYDAHVRTVDGAGNISGDTILSNFLIDQTTNYPSFSLTNLNASPSVNLFGTGGVITGTVTDDDGVAASSIQISFDNGSTWSAVSNPGSDGLTVAWSHTIPAGVLDSGTAYSVRVRANDIGQTVGSIVIPAMTTTTAAYLVAVDRALPSVAASSLNLLNRYTAAPMTISGGAMTGAKLFNNFTLAIDANSAAGLAAAHAVTVSVNGAAAVDATYSGIGTIWNFPVPIDVAGHTNDGNMTLAITVADTWARINTASLAVVIDTTEPGLTFNTPGANANLNGQVTVQGTTFESGGIASWAITGGLASTVIASGTSESTWTGAFAATAFTNAASATVQGTAVTVSAAADSFTTAAPHGLVAGDAVCFYAPASYPGGISGAATYYVRSANLSATSFEVETAKGNPTRVDVTSIGAGVLMAKSGITWLFPITVTCYDATGNRTIATRNVFLDPNGDRPIIVDPTLLPADGAQVSGTILLQSTVTDDDAPAYVRIYADLNDDGIISNNAYPLDLNSNGTTNVNGLNGALNDAFETESTYLQVSVSNGIWNALVNGSNQFSLANMTARGVASPTGYMRFQIVAYDNNATPVASLPAWRRVYLDETAPSIINLNYASGALVKGLINLTCYIEDDAVMAPANMQVSFNGGTSFSALAGFTDLGLVGGKHRYSFTQPIDTTTYFAGSSGIVYVVVKATDGSYKQSQANINFNVDNQYPTGVFNYDSSLTGQMVGGLFDFNGPGGTRPGSAVTADPAADSFASATAHGLTADTQVYFYGTTLPSGISASSVYYVLASGLSSTAFSVSATSGGSKLDFSGTGSGVFVARKGLKNRIIGSVTDPGAISGVDHVLVYFVKHPAAGADRIYTPRLGADANNPEYTDVTGHFATVQNMSGSGISIPVPPMTLDSNAGATHYLTGNNITTLAADKLSLVSASLVGNSYVQPGWIIQFADGEQRIVEGFASGTGTISWNLALAGTAANGQAIILGHYLYYICIDRRTELGAYDSVAGLGDGDGFQEALKAKSGFDEWSTDFDTGNLPDGPITLYYLAVDQVGNTRYATASSQVSNHPPAINSVEITVGSPGTYYTGLFKRAASLYIKVNATDMEGIDNTSYTATVTRTRTAPNGTDVVATPAVGTVLTLSTAGDITQNISTWTSGVQVTLTLQVRDTDANITTTSMDVWVNNTDGTAPRVSIDDLMAATNRSVSTGYIQEAGFSKNDGAAVASPTVTSVAGDLKSAVFSSLIGNGVVAAGQTIAFTSGEWRTISSFASGTGTVGWDSALSGTPSGVATIQAGQADIAGTVTLTGTAWDDTAVTSAQVSLDNGVTWLAVSSLTPLGGDVVNGYDYSWTYVLNTALTDWNGATAGTPVVGLDKPIRIRAGDGTNTGTLTKSGGSPTKIVDVVPYISEIKRLTAGLKTNRTKYGRYSLDTSESTIQVLGFNLNVASAGLYHDTLRGGTADALTPSGVTSPYTSFNLATGAATRSGWLGLSVTTDNGATFIDAINNTDDDTRSYNKAYGTDGASTNYSDDRYFQLWRTGDYFGTAANPSTNPQYPAMTIHPTTSRLFGAWSSYATSDLFFAGVNTDAAPFRTRIYHTYDTAEYVDIFMDDTRPTTTGTLTVAWLANNSSSGSYADGHVSSFPYERNTAFIDGDVFGDGAANLPGNALQWTRDGFNNWYYQGESLDYDKILFQFQNVETARYGANVTWAYYDSLSTTVKFEYVNTATNNVNELGTWLNIDGNVGDVNGGENTRQVGQGIARTTQAGEFLAYTLDEDYYPLIVYYDGINQTLRLARSNKVNPTAITDWTRQYVMLATDPYNPAGTDPNRPSSNGKHISAIVDDTGVLHIAFWSDDTGYLYYIKSTNNPEAGAAYTFGNSEIVDATGTSGLWSDITLNRTTSAPYISYLNSARVNTKDGMKVAYYDSVKGGWEWTVAAASTPVVEKRTNIEYKRGGSPAWDAALGYASTNRFEVMYMMPQVP